MCDDFHNIAGRGKCGSSGKHEIYCAFRTDAADGVQSFREIYRCSESGFLPEGREEDRIQT